MGYTYGTKWNDDLIIHDIMTIVNDMNIKHFPTHTEMKKYYGDQRLIAAVSKYGGTQYWANKLGIPIKECESSFGNTYELQAIEDIEKQTGLSSEITKPRYPYDLLTDRSVKIDVKAAVPSQRTDFKRAWSFNLEKKQQTCDIYIFYCVDNNVVEKIAIIPSVTLSGSSQLGIGNMSKWDIYINRWDIISRYADFFDKDKGKPNPLLYVPDRYSYLKKKE